MNRNVSYDLMRVLACIAVIMVHTAGTGLLPGRDYPIFTHEWYTCICFSSMVRWAVPLFVMISGALFMDEKKEIQICRLYGNNILRLLIILIVWTLLYWWWTNGSIFPLGLTSDHLWYLPMCIILYMAVPILRSISGKMRDYFLIIWGTWLVVDYICMLLDSYPFEIFEHFFFTGYVGYFLLGDWCRRHAENRLLRQGMIWGGVASIGATIVATIWYSGIKCETAFLLNGYFSPSTVVIAMGVFYLCEVLTPKMPIWLSKTICWLSPLTLGIYLVHMEILIQIYTRVQRFVPEPLLLIPIVCGMAFVGGAIFTWIIKKIPYFNKFVV